MAVTDGCMICHRLTLSCIHGGFTMNGSEQEALDFMNWFCDFPYPQKIFICGNHDDCLYGATIDGLDGNVHYLCNSGVEIEGLKFYGVPMFMSDCITDRQTKHYANIPDDTDILITHTPPFGILDFDDNIHYGSEELLTRITAVQQRSHREPFRESQRMAGETGQDTGGQGRRDDRRGRAVLQRGTDIAKAGRALSRGVPAGVCEGTQMRP